MLLAKPAIGTSAHHLEAIYRQKLLTLNWKIQVTAGTTICKFMTEEVRVQMRWALSIADQPFPAYKFLQAIDYTLNGDLMSTTNIQDSTLASIRSVSHNCMIIEIPHYIMEKHLAITQNKVYNVI